jgi:hypothetical protein
MTQGLAVLAFYPLLWKLFFSEEGVNASFNMCGIVDGDPERCLKLAFIDLRFDNGLLLKEVTFLSI